MLVQKNKNFIGKIVSLKLINGEELAARVVNSTDTHISLKRPLLMVMVSIPGKEAKGEVVFAPWMLGIESDEVVHLELSKIFFIADIRKDAGPQYQQATGDFDGYEKL